MPKTNHERNFSDKRDYTVPPGDHTCGKHGAAHERLGLKKFRRSRQRFHQNAQLNNLIDEDASLEPTKFDRRWAPARSKLRQTSASGHEPWECQRCGKKPSILIGDTLRGEEMLCKACDSKRDAKLK